MPTGCDHTHRSEKLALLEFKPQKVIDVGVAYQTLELYQEFREANILLIEPLAEFEPSLRKICATYNAQYVSAAAAETAGMAVLTVHPDKIGSSLLKEIERASVDGAPRQGPVVTIDGVCSEKSHHGPYLVKVDVQGTEPQVIAGASRTPRETEAVILEVTLFGTVISDPQFYDVVAGMKQYGFVAYDFCSFLYRTFDNARPRGYRFRARARPRPPVTRICYARATQSPVSSC